MVKQTVIAAPGKRAHPVGYIQGIPLNLAKIDYVVAEMGRAIAAKEIGHFAHENNTELMYHAMRIPSHAEYIKACDFSLCDGVGVKIAGLMWGHRIPRVNGPILVLEACDKGRKDNWRHYFYGGGPGIAEEMARRLSAKFPGLNVCGTYCPPFRQMSPEEDEEIVKMINDTKPDIVWVGLGLVKQDRWIADHLGRIRTSWMIGEGGVFDYHSGNVPWAPAFVRAIGMEWLFRLIVEPKLRYKRYWWSFEWAIPAFLQGLFTLRILFPDQSIPQDWKR